MKYKLFLAAALLNFMFISHAGADEAPKFDPEWMQCQQDADCVQVNYYTLPANKKYYDQLKAYADKIPCDKCTQPASWPEPLKCVDNICKTQQ